MDIKRDISSFTEILTKISSEAEEGSKNNSVFKDKYIVRCVHNWKPWPNLPEDQFRKCFIVTSAYDNQHIERTANETLSNYDYVGNPLELSWKFAANNKAANETTHYSATSDLSIQNALSISDARYMCDLHALLPNDSLRKIPLFSFCDGKDKQKTILLGNGKNIRVIGYDSGILTRKDEYPWAAEVRNTHISGIPLPHPQMDYSVYLFYDFTIKDAWGNITSILRPSSKGFLGIECRGTTFSRILQKPPIDCTCVMIVEAVVGDKIGGAAQKYKELQFIKKLYNSLQTGEMSWSPSDNQPAPLQKKLLDFLDDLKQGRIIKTTPEIIDIRVDPTDFDTVLASYAVKEREDKDFTDHLWSIMQDCKSYKELCDGMILLFEEMKFFPFMPYISNKNETTIAKLIKNMNEHPVKCPNFSSTKPIELLLEMGIEKLRKDYVMLFVGLEMVPYSFLVPFLKEFSHVGKAIGCLEKFHAVLEMLIMVWTFLRLQKKELSSFVRTTLKYFHDVPAVDPSYMFKFPVSMCGVKDALEKIDPVIWQATIKSGDGVEKENIFFYKKLHNVDTSKENVAAPYFLATPPYHGTSITVIKDNLGLPVDNASK